MWAGGTFSWLWRSDGRLGWEGTVVSDSLSDPLSILAMTGASTIVAAMATSAWEATRDKAAALFRWRRAAVREGEVSPEVAVVRAELEASAAQVRCATEPEGARAEQTEVWRRRLVDLLGQERDAAAELANLIEIEEARARLKPADPEPPTYQQNITVSGGGTAYGAVGPGSGVYVYGHTPPQPPASRPTGGEAS